MRGKKSKIKIKKKKMIKPKWKELSYNRENKIGRRNKE
jgi:hypothetical protein